MRKKQNFTNENCFKLKPTINQHNTQGKPDTPSKSSDNVKKIRRKRQFSETKTNLRNLNDDLNPLNEIGNEINSLNRSLNLQEETQRKVNTQRPFESFGEINDNIDKKSFYEALKCCGIGNWNTNFFNDLNMECQYAQVKTAKNFKQKYEQKLEQIMKFITSIKSFANTKMKEESVPNNIRYNKQTKVEDITAEKLQGKRIWRQLNTYITFDCTKEYSNFFEHKTKEGHKISFDMNRDSDVKNSLAVKYKSPFKIKNLEKDVFNRTVDFRIKTVNESKDSYITEKYKIDDDANFDINVQHDFNRKIQASIRKGSPHNIKQHNSDTFRNPQFNASKNRKTVSERHNSIQSKLKRLMDSKLAN